MAMEQQLTVDVISAEQTSQTYLTPPSPPLAAVFFLMTPMVAPWFARRGWGVDYPRGVAQGRGRLTTGRRRREKSAKRTSIGSACDLHEESTRISMDFGCWGGRSDGIGSAQCWLVGEAQRRWQPARPLCNFLADACSSRDHPKIFRRPTAVKPHLRH